MNGWGITEYIGFYIGLLIVVFALIWWVWLPYIVMPILFRKELKNIKESKQSKLRPR